MRRLLYLAALSMLVAAMTANVAVAQDDLDCADFGSQAEAQQVLRQDPSDPNNLDGEDDGVACETFGYPEGAATDLVPVQPAVSPTGDLDCEDFATQEEAQAVYNQDPSDPNNLDRDNDGLACEESLPGADDGDNLTELVDEPTAGDQYAGDDQYADDGAVAPELPDTGGPALLPVAGLALIGLGGLLFRRR